MNCHQVSALRRALRDYGTLGELVCNQLTIAISQNNAWWLQYGDKRMGESDFLIPPVGTVGEYDGIRYVVVPARVAARIDAVRQPPALDIDHD